MLFHVPGGKSSPGFPGTVTRPGLSGCLNWRWLPLVRTSRHPSSSINCMASLTLGIVGSSRSKPQPGQVVLDGRVQPLRLGLLLPPLGGEPGHLLLEGFPVVLLRRRADVAAGSEYVAVLADVLQRSALAEAGNVGVLAGPSSPRQAWYVSAMRVMSSSVSSRWVRSTMRPSCGRR